MSCVQAYYGSYSMDPVPLMGISKSYTRKGNEGKLVGETSITLNGTLVFGAGINAIMPSGTDSNIAELRSMQNQLEDAFSVDRQNLYIVDASGYVILSVYPRVESINFDEDVLVQKSNYSISLSVTEEEQSDFVDSSSNTWDTIINPDNTRTVTHNVNAKGIRGDYGEKSADVAFVNVKDYVLTKINQDAALQQYFIDASGYTSYNHTKQETSDLDGATYGISESWTLSNQSYVDDRSTSVSTEIQPNGDEVVTVTINGTVTGLATQDEPTSVQRLTAADNAFENIIAAQIGFNAANVTSKTKDTNAFTGTVNYSVTKTSDDSSDDLNNKTIDRQFSRNEDGSTTQTVTVSATVVPQSSGTISDAITWVDAKIDHINSSNPPYTIGNGVLISRASTRNDIQLVFSRTNVYQDVSNLSYREEYTTSATISENGILTVNIGGSIFGLDDESTTSSEERFAKAETAYPTVDGLAFSRANELATDLGRTLTNNLISQTLAYNNKNGIIIYSNSYNDKTAPPDGIKSESLSISDSGGDPVVVQVPIPGRALGPIFQILSTITVYARVVNLQWTLDDDFSEASADALAKTTIEAYEPDVLTIGGEQDVTIIQTKRYDPITREYNRNVTWTYNLDGTSFRLDILGE